MDNELGFPVGFKTILKVRRRKLVYTGEADRGIQDNSVKPGPLRQKNGVGLRRKTEGSSTQRHEDNF